MGTLGFKIINHKEKHQVWIQSYIYMAFQPKTMDIEILFLVINIIANINNQGNENDYTTNGKTYHNQDWGEEFFVAN